MNIPFNSSKIILNVNKNKLSLETHVLLFIKCYCEIKDLQYIFNDNLSDPYAFVLSENVNLDTDVSQLNPNYQLCELPLYIDYSGIIHSGLCNVVRKVVSNCQNFKYLLGATGCCLKACAEVSNWTKFIEVDFPIAIRKLILNIDMNVASVQQSQNSTDDNIYEIFNTFERYLNQSPVISNISKLQHKNKKIKNTNFYPNICHIRYAEGLDFLLTDLLLFVYISISLNLNSNLINYIQSKCLNICKWYNCVLENNASLKLVALNCGLKIYCLSIEDKHINNPTKKITISTINTEFNLDKYPNIKMPQGFCKDIEQDLFSYKILEPKLDDHLFECFESILEEISSQIFIEDNFPIKRREKKLQQLQNMAASILCLKPQSGQIIVDFCCGSGHLGILMAHLLPNCKIILIENKEESLERAFKQAHKLHLKNVTFIRSNIGHFKERFDIGICLHGCGLVTDLVLNKCFTVKANYVICPCCYGATKNTKFIKYPRSQLFRSINYSSFHHILQAADAPIPLNSLEARDIKPIKSALNQKNKIQILDDNSEPAHGIEHMPNLSNQEKENTENCTIDLNSTLNGLSNNLDNITIHKLGDNINNKLNFENIEVLVSTTNSFNKQATKDMNLIPLPEYLKEKVNILNTEISAFPGNLVENSVTIESCLTKRCMYIVDSDRQQYARELGYQIDIRTMYPPICTPKNNIIIGKFCT